MTTPLQSRRSTARKVAQWLERRTKLEVNSTGVANRTIRPAE